MPSKIEPDVGSGLALGKGVNSLTLDELNPGIDVHSEFTPDGADGQAVVYEFKEITTVSQLRETLNVSASAAFGGGGAGISAKASYFHSVAYSSYALYLYIRVKVTNSSKALREFKLTTPALNYLKEYGKDAFFEVYGDEFVSSYTTGGEFLAVFEISTESEEEKSRVQASLSGSYGAFSASAEFSKAMERFNATTATRLYLMRRGGVGDLPEMGAVKNAALAFPDKVSQAGGHPVLLQVNTLEYGATTNRPNNIDLISLEPQKQALERMAQIREKVVSARVDLQYAANNPYLFNAGDSVAFLEGAVMCATTLKQIDNAAEQCWNTKGRICLEPAVTLPPESPRRILIPEPGLTVMVHAAGIGNMTDTANKYVGTQGQSRQIEGIAIEFNPPVPGLHIEYFVHGQQYADRAWVRDGAFCGTTGQSLRVEGFQIRLVGPLAKFYDVIYTGHFADVGNQQCKNDEFCGSRGQNRRCEGIRVSVSLK